MLGEQADQLAWYDHLASGLDRTDHGSVPVLASPRFRGPLEAGEVPGSGPVHGPVGRSAPQTCDAASCRVDRPGGGGRGPTAPPVVAL